MAMRGPGSPKGNKDAVLRGTVDGVGDCGRLRVRVIILGDFNLQDTDDPDGRRLAVAEHRASFGTSAALPDSPLRRHAGRRHGRHYTPALCQLHAGGGVMCRPDR